MSGEGRVASSQRLGALCGLAAATTFGISAPLAKLLLGEVPPVLLAGLLYAGAAVGLWIVAALRPVTASTAEAPMRSADYARLGAVVVFGGVAGPVLMLLGLSRVSALTGSLLLNLEAPMTIVLATALFGEHLGRRAAMAAAFVVAGAAVLRLEPGELGGVPSGDPAGVLLLAAACACWGLDNNWTQRLSLKDPFAIVRVKATVAGVVNTGLGLAVAGGEMPPLGAASAALLLGAVSYGASVVLDAYALRFLGAAREAAFFATAPFVGAAVSVVLLGDPVGAADAVAVALMAAGVALLLRERHSHRHVHEPMQHEHRHVHDEHHRHRHEPTDPPGEPHSHPHRHELLEHEHPHVSDAHHRHRH